MVTFSRIDIHNVWKLNEVSFPSLLVTSHIFCPKVLFIYSALHSLNNSAESSQNIYLIGASQGLYSR